MASIKEAVTVEAMTGYDFTVRRRSNYKHLCNDKCDERMNRKSFFFLIISPTMDAK